MILDFNFKNIKMNIIQVYSCSCNPSHTYVSKATYNAHLKTKRHVGWEAQLDNKKLRARIVELENEISRKKVELHHWKESFIALKQKYEPCDLLD